MLDDELADEPAEGEPAELAAAELEEEPSPRQRPEQPGSAAQAELLEQLRREAVERRDGADQPLDVARLLLEHLRGEISEDGASGAAHAFERTWALSSRDRPKRLDRQPRCGGPSVRGLVEVAGELGFLVPERRREQRSDLLDRERELRARDLQHLSLRSQAVDRKRQLGPRGEYEMEARRRLADEAFDESGRRALMAELLQVVHDQGEVASKPCGQYVAQEPGELPGSGRSVVVRVRSAHALGRSRDLDRKIRETQLQRVDDPAGERGQSRVLLGGRVPGARDLVGPGRQQGGLAEAGPRDREREASVERLVQARLEVRPAQRRRGHRRYDDLGRRRAGDERVDGATDGVSVARL